MGQCLPSLIHSRISLSVSMARFCCNDNISMYPPTHTHATCSSLSLFLFLNIFIVDSITDVPFIVFPMGPPSLPGLHHTIILRVSCQPGVSSRSPTLGTRPFHVRKRDLSRKGFGHVLSDLATPNLQGVGSEALTCAGEEGRRGAGGSH